MITGSAVAIVQDFTTTCRPCSVIKEAIREPKHSRSRFTGGERELNGSLYHFRYSKPPNTKTKSTTEKIKLTSGAHDLILLLCHIVGIKKP